MRSIKTGDEAMPWPQLHNWIIIIRTATGQDGSEARAGTAQKMAGDDAHRLPEAETMHRMLAPNTTRVSSGNTGGGQTE